MAVHLQQSLEPCHQVIAAGEAQSQATETGRAMGDIAVLRQLHHAPRRDLHFHELGADHVVAEVTRGEREAHVIISLALTGSAPIRPSRTAMHASTYEAQLVQTRYSWRIAGVALAA